MHKTEYELLADDCLSCSRSITAGFPLADDCLSYRLSITAGFPLVRRDIAELLLRAHEAITSLDLKSIELSRLNSNKDLSVINLKAELSLYERSQN